MGTRGFVTVVVDGSQHTVHNSMDSYPSGLGVDVLADLRRLVEHHSPATLRDLAATLAQAPEDPASGPTIRDAMRAHPGLAKRVDRYLAEGHLTPEMLSAPTEDTWRRLSHFEGLAEWLEVAIYEPYPWMPVDSGYAAWGYVVDLDRDNGPDRAPGVFEVYRGMQRSVPKQGLWRNRPTRSEMARDHADHVAWCAEKGLAPWLDRTPRFKACAPVAVWALDSLPGVEALIAVECIDRAANGKIPSLLATDVPPTAAGVVSTVGTVSETWPAGEPSDPDGGVFPLGRLVG